MNFLFSTVSVVLVVFLTVTLDYYWKEFNSKASLNNQDPSRTLTKYVDVWDSNEIITRYLKGLRNYTLGEKLGTVTIPALNIYEQPIYYGSNMYTNNWRITVPGYLGGYGMFGDKLPTALGAHNYQIFSNLSDIKEGDKLIVETEGGDKYVYEVIGSDIYRHGEDSWVGKTRYTAEDYSLMLMTCYPIAKVETDDMYIVYTRMLSGVHNIYEDKE